MKKKTKEPQFVLLNASVFFCVDTCTHIYDTYTYMFY